MQLKNNNYYSNFGSTSDKKQEADFLLLTQNDESLAWITQSAYSEKGENHERSDDVRYCEPSWIFLYQNSIIWFDFRLGCTGL